MVQTPMRPSAGTLLARARRERFRARTSLPDLGAVLSSPCDPTRSVITSSALAPRSAVAHVVHMDNRAGFPQRVRSRTNREFARSPDRVAINGRCAATEATRLCRIGETRVSW